MNQHNDNREDNKEITVQEFLQQIGIAAAVEAFLGKEEVNGLLNEVHGTGCLQLTELIETMPASIQESLNKALEGLEGQYNDYIKATMDRFKEELASGLFATTEILSPTAATKVMYAYQDDLDACSDEVMQLMRDMADEIWEYGKGKFLNRWGGYMNKLENNEDRVRLLKAIMGDEFPESENCVVIPVMAGDIADAFKQLEMMLSGEYPKE